MLSRMRKRATIGCTEVDRDAFNRIAQRWGIDQSTAFSRIVNAMQHQGDDLQQLLLGVVNVSDLPALASRFADAFVVQSKLKLGYLPNPAAMQVLVNQAKTQHMSVEELVKSMASRVSFTESEAKSPKPEESAPSPSARSRGAGPQRGRQS